MKALYLVSIVWVLFFGPACAARSPMEARDYSTFNSTPPPTDLAVYVRTMSGQGTQDLALIDLGEIRGDTEQFTQVLCRNLEGNVEVLLMPAMGTVDDRFQYYDRAYSMDFYLGQGEPQKTTPAPEPHRIGINFSDVHRMRPVFEMDTTVFETWYIMSAGSVKKGGVENYVGQAAGARRMTCATRQRTRRGP